MLKDMNGYGFSLILILLGLALIGGLILMANQGSVAAIATLAVIGALTLVLVGFVISHLSDTREHSQKLDEAEQTIKLMRQQSEMVKAEFVNAVHNMQLINRQNTQLWMQASKQARLPEPKMDYDSFVEIDEASFEVSEQ